MTALHRVKAYFGMVPADELDAYDGYGEYVGSSRTGDPRDRYDSFDGPADRYSRRPRHERYDGDRYDSYESDRYGPERYESDRYDSDRYESERYEDGRAEPGRRSEYDRRAEPARADDRTRTPRPRDPEPEGRDTPRLAPDADRTPAGDRDEEADVSVRTSARGRSWAENTGPNHTSRSGRSGALSSVGGSGSTSGSSLSGSLAGSGASLSASGAAALALDEPVRPVRPVEPTPPAAKAPDTPAVPEITTLKPTSYNEARTIGERYRDGIPVIMNLTEMDDVAAKRLVDFAAGLAFALRGSIEKVTNRVFLLSPPNVEVSATDRRKFAESSFVSSS